MMIAAAGILQGVSIIVGALVGSSLLGAVFVGGVLAWREKAGTFYKAVAEEKDEENSRLKRELEQQRKLTDLTPIVTALDGVTSALERHAKLTEQVFAKVADMNGSLRAHGEAMKALADRMILDEAARGLLKAAAQSPTETHRSRRPG